MSDSHPKPILRYAPRGSGPRPASRPDAPGAQALPKDHGFDRRDEHRDILVGAAHAALVDHALAHLQRHYREPNLSLRTLAGALGCNGRYLTIRFSEIAGEHLRTYLITLRVSHACGLFLGSGASSKEVAHASGFLGSNRLASVFRTHVGASPREYRRIFSNY